MPARAFKFSIAVSLLLWVCGCSRSVTLEYVFPDGFSGIAKLCSNKPTGVTLVATNGVITLAFPPSGILDIKGKLPTLDWHRPIARYQNGKTIPVVTPPNKVSDDEIALRGLGLKNNVESWYLVGKFDEVRAALTQKNGFEYPSR